MNKQFALEILTEVQGTSASYVREYGMSIVREAVNYMRRLKKLSDSEIRIIDRVQELVRA